MLLFEADGAGMTGIIFITVVYHQENLATDDNFSNNIVWSKYDQQLLPLQQKDPQIVSEHRCLISVHGRKHHATSLQLRMLIRAVAQHYQHPPRRDHKSTGNNISLSTET